jgi:hypothetical protein
MKPLPKSQIFRFTEKAIYLACHAASRYSSKFSKHRYTLPQHVVLPCLKVRTGSSRQHRYGDIDGYYGSDLMISVEVKDRDIDASNVYDELGTMMDVAENTTSLAIAICRRISEGARDILEDSGVHILDDDDLLIQLEIWGYRLC